MFNPLIIIEAYMNQIIAYTLRANDAYICVKDEGAHFHGILAAMKGQQL